MPNIILSQKNSIIAVGIVLVLLGGGYYFFQTTSVDSSSSGGAMDVSLLDPKIQTFLTSQSKIDIKDDSFRKGKNEQLYNSLKDYSVSIPLVDPPGRANPFVPYNPTP